MNWWRAYHGLPNDPKLAMVAASRHVTPCHATRGDVLGVWVALLDYASQNSPRGSLEGVDPKQIAWVLEVPIERVNAIILAMQDMAMIVSNILKAWDKRQPKREREDPDAAERKRKQRSHQVTPVTPSPALEEKRREEKREEHTQAGVRVQPTGAANLNGQAKRCGEFAAAFPDQSDQNSTVREYLSLVTVLEEDLVFACLERYRASAQVARGVVQAGWKWLRTQKENGWRGQWVSPKNGRQSLDELAAQVAIEMEAEEREIEERKRVKP